MKIYVVFKEENGVDKFVCVFTNEKKAEAYCIYKNEDEEYMKYWYCPDYTSNVDFRF